MPVLPTVVIDIEPNTMDTGYGLKNIPETFSGVDVFITGGTGFMGKILIEKIVRSCPDVKNVFVLVRSQKGKSAQERITEMLSVPLFDVVRKLFPEFAKKIIAIEGDCVQLKLGLDVKNVQRLQAVQFVFHVAASVRFDDPLKKAILMNVRGTRELLDLCKTLTKLRAVVHVSTAYCNPEVFDVEELIYPAKMSWKDAIRYAEQLDDEIFETLTLKLTNFAINTYTFTKGLAEQICKDYSDEIPLTIMRPSVVTNTEREPIPGWIDNFSGPTSLLIGGCTGVLRVIWLKLDKHINCIPADVCIKSFIIAAWKRANCSSKHSLDVYNCAVDHIKSYTYRFFCCEAMPIYYKIPYTSAWYKPGYVSSAHQSVYLALFILLQLPPALIVDFVQRLQNKHRKIFKLLRAGFQATMALKHFTHNEWQINNKNFRNLSNELLRQDRKDFSLDHITESLMEYFRISTLGSRRYLLKDPDHTIPAAIKQLKRYHVIDDTLKVLLVGVFFWFVYCVSLK
ncbi:fatty acyl-CoA reductase 1-like [Uranotaenia lowii]|uniref:fatty acyl-CoA reductase 1-like n=1 Tax=Uranotaenia lowii TaxID=190385 RepID=UPI002479F58E|nr:fatty acyl-CoA reductase 1-like [Uranotaenia lowii]